MFSLCFCVILIKSERESNSIIPYPEWQYLSVSPFSVSLTAPKNNLFILSQCVNHVTMYLIHKQ